MPAVLTLVRIKNLALVEELAWQMGPGFLAVTGETGAGKSIIIGALQLLLGERADKSLIRSGADLCTVEAVFSGDDLQKSNPQLVEAGIEPSENDLIIRRSFSATGGKRQFINGSPTTLSILKILATSLSIFTGRTITNRCSRPRHNWACLIRSPAPKTSSRSIESITGNYRHWSWNMPR